MARTTYATENLPWEPIPTQEETTKTQDLPPLFFTGLMTLLFGTVVLSYIALTGWRPRSVREKQ